MLPVRFIDKIANRPDDPHENLPLDVCWIWGAAKTSTGYGSFRLSRERKTVGAHRFAYEQMIGPIPEGHDLHHVCRIPACVNPWHLEPIPAAEHRAMRKTHCRKGHELTADNTIEITMRKCRACHNAVQRRYQTKRRGQ